MSQVNICGLMCMINALAFAISFILIVVLWNGKGFRTFEAEKGIVCCVFCWFIAFMAMVFYAFYMDPTKF